MAAIKRDAQNERNNDDALTAYIREAAYTLLNRLIGLRCMEARNILYVDGEQNEVVTLRPEYGERSRFSGRCASRTEAIEPTRRCSGKRAYSRLHSVTHDIALLFDPNSEWSQLWPTHKTLMEAVKLITGLGCRVQSRRSLLGLCVPGFPRWMYQFFNVEEKEQIWQVDRR